MFGYNSKILNFVFLFRIYEYKSVNLEIIKNVFDFMNLEYVSYFFVYC